MIKEEEKKKRKDWSGRALTSQSKRVTSYSTYNQRGLCYESRLLSYFPAGAPRHEIT